METKQAQYCFGKPLKSLFLVLCLGIIAACSDSENAENSETEENLWNFAYANCLYQYFAKQGWEISDIRAISGGYVEMGDSGPDTYGEINRIVETWQPDIATKQDIDVDLMKCFQLESNDQLVQLIRGS